MFRFILWSGSFFGQPNWTSVGFALNMQVTRQESCPELTQFHLRSAHHSGFEVSQKLKESVANEIVIGVSSARTARITGLF